jgi:hypothetical protein
VFENRVLRGIFGSKKNDVTGEWKKLHNEELNNMYCSTNIFRGIKSRRMRWVAGGEFLGLCDEKSSYKHVSDFGRLRSCDRLKLRIEGNDYSQ